MSGYLCQSAFWSALGFVLGYLTCYLGNRTPDMTTPERLRARQRRESAFIAILAILLCVAVVYFRGQDAAQDRCLSSFVETQNATSAVRSKLVERESHATRTVIAAAGAAKTRRDFDRAFREYRREVRSIDQARDDNPIRMFPDGICE